MSNRKTAKNKGFRPTRTFILPTPYVKPLEEGDVLTPHLDAEDEQEKAIAANPVTSGYVERYGHSATQPRVRYEAYSAGWEDCGKLFQAAYAARDAVLAAEFGPVGTVGTPLSDVHINDALAEMGFEELHDEEFESQFRDAEAANA